MCWVFIAAYCLSSCGAEAELPEDIWDLPGPGIKPKSSALTGIFFFFFFNLWTTSTVAEHICCCLVV